MSFTTEIDSFLEKYAVDSVLDEDAAKAMVENAALALDVRISPMSCGGDGWKVIRDDMLWTNFKEIKSFLDNMSGNRLFVFFNGHPRHRVVKINLTTLLEMMEDDDFFHNIFAFDKKLENALFDDHSGLFCGMGYFSDAIKAYC